jgi:hypothetical protein
MNIHAPLHRPPHARIDHDAIHRAGLRAAGTCRPARPHRWHRRPRVGPTTTVRTDA